MRAHTSTLIRTPYLDSLAAEATHLTRFRAPSWCAPSRATFLTGRHGHELGSWMAPGTNRGNESVLVSELLKDAGYHTAIGALRACPCRPKQPSRRAHTPLAPRAVGKWHFGPCAARTPFIGTPQFGCGFDQQYGFQAGQSDYYNHDPSWSRDGVKLRDEGCAASPHPTRAACTRLARAPFCPLGCTSTVMTLPRLAAALHNALPPRVATPPTSSRPHEGSWL